MHRLSASSSVRKCGPGVGSGHGHAGTWEHCVHLLVPAAMGDDTALCAPKR